METFELIDVPYKSQWDTDAHLSRGDCGIVCAAMICSWKGMDISPDALILKAGLPIGAHSYSFAQIINSAKTQDVYLVAKQGATWDVIKSSLVQKRPVINLLRYGEISGNQDDFDGSHFWVAVGFDSNFVYVNDPDYWSPRRSEGEKRRIPIEEFKRSIGSALIATGNNAYQSLFLV